MKEIYIECAGAGKTYGIAQKIANITNECLNGKKVYAITYTNYAVSQIQNELKKTIYEIPENVIIKTVHGFLLENIIYPYSRFTKGEPINTCSIEKLPKNDIWKAKRKKALKNEKIIHSSDVSQFARSVLIALKSDNNTIKKKKEIALEYFVSDIYCLFVDEAQDMDKYFFELMYHIIRKIEHFYFVGDPYQALWTTDKYREFSENVAKIEGVSLILNLVSRRIPTCIIPLCNNILPDENKLDTINEVPGVVAYTLLSNLCDETIKKLTSSNVFSYIKYKTDVFITANEQTSLTPEFTTILAERYPTFEIGALRRAVINAICSKGLDTYLKRRKISLSDQAYRELADQFQNENQSGIYVEAIHRIKGLENDTAYFIVCNSLLEILLGFKNDFNNETNLLYVALTRTKRRLLLIIDDDNTTRKNIEKRKINIDTRMIELGINRAILSDWF